MTSFNRRTLVVGACACAAPCSASASESRGCRDSARPNGFWPIQDIELGQTPDQSTGDPNLDSLIEGVRVSMSDFFGVRPGFGIYDDSDDPNAKALKETLIEGTTGTVCLGATLMRRQMTGTNDGGVSVVAVVAHEFAHIFQYQNGMDDRLAPGEAPVKLLELNADFFTGLYLAQFQRAVPEARLYNTGRVFAGLGDTRFGSFDHHGTADERVSAIQFGHRFGVRHPEIRPGNMIEESILFVSTRFGAR